MKKVFLLLNFTLIIACSTKKETNFKLSMEEETFVNMMAEIHLAEAGVKVLKNLKERDFPYELPYLYNSIYDKYDFSQKELEKIIEELAIQPEEMKRLFKKVENRLSEWETNTITIEKK